MRVLFLTHSYPRHPGDASGSFLLRLAQALSAEDVSVHVVAPAASGLPASETIDGIPVTRFRYAPRRYETLAYTGTMAESVASSWRARLAMLSFLGAAFIAAMRERRRLQPDVIHAHWWFPNGWTGTWVGAFTGVPLVTTVHGTDIRMLEAVPALKPLARRVLNRSTSVTAVSHWLAQQGATLMTKTTPLVAPMPAAVEWFTPDGPRITNRLLFVGRLNAQKGIEYAIRALAAMPPSTCLDVIGTSPRLGEYQALAQTLGVANRVVFLGAVAQHELAPFYRRSAALVVPSVDEGLGLVAVEAQLCETPVVAFASGGMTDVIQHGRTGLLVPACDVTALASALEGLLKNPLLAAELGRAGRVHALATFAPVSVARRYAGIYKDAVLRRRAA